MALNRKTAVIGTSIMVPVNDESRSLEELLYDAAQSALKDAGLAMDDIDGLVVASNDQFDGRAISVMAASGSVGGVDRDILSTPSAGEHAVVMGVLRIASGLYETHLVMSWSPTEASSLPEAQRLGADPYFHRNLPLDELSAAALQAGALLHKHPWAMGVAESITTRRLADGAKAYPLSQRQAGASSKPRWPLSEQMISPPVTGVVALVLASEDFVAERGIVAPAWINGMGWATEASFLGDRDLATAPALEEAARRAYEEAGITNPREAFDLIEITGSTAYQELIAWERLGLSSPDRMEADEAEGVFHANGSTPINLSGGVAALNPVFCTGTLRVAEAANQIRGRAGNHQLAEVKTALAHAASGFAMMYQTVFVLGAETAGGRS